MTEKSKIINNILSSQENIKIPEPEEIKSSSNTNKDNVISDILSKREKNVDQKLFAEETSSQKSEDRKQNLIALLTGEDKPSEVEEEVKEEIKASVKPSPPSPSSPEQIRRKKLVASLSGSDDSEIDKVDESKNKISQTPNHLKYINGNTLTVHTFLKKLNVYKDKSYDDLLLLVESIIFEFVEESERKKFTYEVLKTVANSFKPNSIQ